MTDRDAPTNITKKSIRSTILLLGGVAALGSLATQLIVPALPTIASEMKVGVASAQLVVGVFLIGLGGGQLVMGPLSDRVDRRNLLFAGLLIYAAGSLVAGLAPGMGMLLVARTMQALGGAALLVTSRLLLNATVPRDKAVSAQASLMAIVLISPALAPVIGGLLTEWMGWRAIMLILCAAGLIGGGIVLKKIPAQNAASTPSAPANLRHAYKKVLGNPRFRSAGATLALSSATLYAFLGAAPFLLEQSYHLTPRQIGLCLLVVAGMSIAGTRTVSRVQKWMSPMVVGTLLALTSAVLIALISFQGNPSIVILLLPLALLGLTAGMIGPTAIVHVMASEPGLEGTATSLAGAVQMGGSAFVAWLVGPFAAQSTLNLALTLIPLTCLSLGSAIAADRASRA